MDHPEVRQHLADALAAGTLPSLLEADLPAWTSLSAADAAALRAHLRGCATCRAEAGSLMTTGVYLAAATPDDVQAPVAARERILRSVRETGMVRGAAPAAATSAADSPGSPRWRWPWRRLPALAAVAMAVVIVGGLVAVVQLDQQRNTARTEAAALADLSAASARILAEPDHAQLALVTAAGAPGGMVVYGRSSGQLAVWSRDLDSASEATGYDCYVLHQGALTLIGWMEEAGSIAYWVGQVPPGVTLGRAGDRIVVQADRPGATAVLSGDF